MYAGQKSVRDGIEDFMCPFTDFYMTCGPNESQFHMGTMAIDVRGAEPGVCYAYYAPATVRCITTYPQSGQAMWQTVNNVRCSNGYIGKVTFMTVHDDTLNAYPGMIVNQGDQLGNMGTKGYATGVHCHIECSQSDDTSWWQNSYGNWNFNYEVDPEDVFFMDNTNILNGMGNWKYLSDVPVKDKVTPNVDKDEYKNQIEVIVPELRVRTDASLGAEILGYAGQGYFDYYETRDNDDYTWYRIADNQWIAYSDEWERVYPAKPREEFVNIPPTLEARNIYMLDDKIQFAALNPGNTDGLSYKILSKDGEYVEIAIGNVWVKVTDNTPVTNKPQYNRGNK